MPDFVPFKRPVGLLEIVATFGDLNSYISLLDNGTIRLDPEFENKFIRYAKLPYPLLTAEDCKKKVPRIKCHELLVERFQALFEEIADRNLTAKALYFGGCYNFRPKRNGRGMSTHSWGIAIDLNPATNISGKLGDMAPDIVAIFTKYGFEWGGTWRGKLRDPMHFQYCSGY